jgi:competence protein ComEA
MRAARRIAAALPALCLAAALGSTARAAPPASAAPAAVHAAGSVESARKAPRARPVLRGTLNLNQADADALELLPGIGPVKAERIVVFRRSHPFRRVDDLTRVKGIGRKTLARLRPFLTVAGPTTLARDPAGEKSEE